MITLCKLAIDSEKCGNKSGNDPQVTGGRKEDVFILTGE